MASSVGKISTDSFPPAASLPAALLSSQQLVLAARAFGGDTGYPTGLVLNAALQENDSGRFSLVSGLTIASSATAIASAQVEKIQEKLNSIQSRLSILANDSYSDIEKDRQRLLLKFDMEDISKAIDEAGIGDFNLIDAGNSSGVKLNITSGAFANTGKTANENIAGHDRTFDYAADELSYQTTDLRAAFDDVRQLEVLTYPGAEENQQSNGHLYSLTRFQGAIDQARTNLNEFRSKLVRTATDNVSISGDPSGTITDGSDARQIASRLAQQLSRESFNITSHPAAKYFSLFT